MGLNFIIFGVFIIKSVMLIKFVSFFVLKLLIILILVIFAVKTLWIIVILVLFVIVREVVLRFCWVKVRFLEIVKWVVIFVISFFFI